MRTAIYLRKSRTEEQNEPVETTLKRHREQLLEFAEKNALEIIEIYEEVVSGETLCSRPQMLRLLSNIENGSYDAVLCIDIDRLGRGSMRDQGFILETFKRANTRIITPHRTYDLQDELDETYSEFETFMARQELKQIKRRLNRGRQKTIQDGGYLANAPYGYHKIVKNHLPTLEPIEEEAYFIRMIFDLYVHQGIGSHTIARTISTLGAKPRRGEQFSRGSIRKILKNPVYTGQIIWNRTCHLKNGSNHLPTPVVPTPPEQWLYADGLHKALIDPETFAQAQEILTEHAHPPSYDGTISNPLAGLVRCGGCGGLMQRRVCGGSVRRAYLVCQNPACMPSAQLEFVEQAVLDLLQKRFAQILIPPEQAEQGDPSIPARALRETKQEQTLVKQQLSRLHNLLEQHIYDVQTFQMRRTALTKTLALLSERETALSKLLLESAVLPPPCDGKTVLAVYLTANAQIKNELLKTVVHEIIYYKEPKSKPHAFTLFLEVRDF